MFALSYYAIQTYLPKTEDFVEHVDAGSQVGW